MNGAAEHIHTEPTGTARASARPDGISAEIEQLTRDLATVLEAIDEIEQRKRPYWLAIYQQALGEPELRLLELQVSIRTYQFRIELLQTRLNRGDALCMEDIRLAERQAEVELAQWRATLGRQADALREGLRYLSCIIQIPLDQVTRAKQAYRRLARLLHPDVSPERSLLFEKHWLTVQAAYAQCDAELLEALLHLIEQDTGSQAEATEQEAQRLRELICHHTERLSALQNAPPLCWAQQLSDPDWLAAKRAEIELQIESEAGRLAALIARHAALCALAAGSGEVRPS